MKPPYVAVVLAVSTGGPQTLATLFENFHCPIKTPIFLVQHAPGWALTSIASSLNRKFDFDCQVAEDGMLPKKNCVYIAPGDRHMVLSPRGHSIRIIDTPKENFVRPAADPLFKSVANAFGSHSIGVVLSGMGKDGKAGSEAIKSAGGVILAQDPKTAISPYMPRSVINADIKAQVVPLCSLGQTLTNKISALSVYLQKTA